MDDNFIEKYYPLVVGIAKKYGGRKQDLEDLIQEGFIGLIKAHKKYIPQKGVKFSTYATYWIKSEMVKYLKQNTLIRIPLWVQEKKNKNLINSCPKVCAKAEFLEGSFDNTLFNSDCKKTNIESQIIEKERTETLNSFLDFLSPEESGVIRLRYGLRTSKNYTITKVAEMMGFSTAKVLSLQKKGENKLKSRAKGRYLN